MTTGGNGVVRGDRSLTRMAWQRAPASRSCRSCTPGRCSSGGPGGSSGTPQCRRPAGSSWARRNWAPPLAPWASSPSKRSATPGTPLFLAAKSTLSPRPPLATGSAGSAFVREGPQKGGVRCPSRVSALRFLAAHSCVPRHTEKKKKNSTERERERRKRRTNSPACVSASAVAPRPRGTPRPRPRSAAAGPPSPAPATARRPRSRQQDRSWTPWLRPTARAPRLDCENKREREISGGKSVRQEMLPSVETFLFFCFFFFPAAAAQDREDVICTGSSPNQPSEERGKPVGARAKHFLA